METCITMNTYVMLFRGINVGGRNILPMKELAKLLETKGFKNVRTYIQSGNVLLSSSQKPDDSVRLAIQTKYGFSPDIMIFEIAEFEAMVKNCPFVSEVGKSIHFYFCDGQAKPDTEKLERFVSTTEQYEIKGRVFYLYAPDGIGRSKLASKVEACLGVSGTGRNLNTVSKILELAEKA
jgi:uncharacterized protein (DUF1697 family)